MRRILPFLYLTLLEAGRDKLYLGIVFFSVGFVTLSLLLGMSPWGHIEDIMFHLGFGGTSIFSLIYGLILTTNSIHRDVQGKTVYAVFSRPVRRHEFIVGKYAGVLLTLFIMIFSLSFFITFFTFSAGYSGTILWQSVAIGWRIFLQTMVTCSFAVLFSTFTSHGLSIILAFMLHFISSNSRVLYEMGQKSGSLIPGKIVSFIYYLLPDYGYLYIDERVIHFHEFPLKVLLSGTLFSLIYSGAILFISSIIFSKREL